MAEDAPFFIVGAGRSGTTLLRLILTGHSRLHIPAETWFLRGLVRDFPLTGALTQAQLERVILTMVGHERWPDMELTECELRRRAVELDQPRLVDLVDIVYRHLLAENGKQRLGDKTPHYFTIVPELVTLYPAAKFIHLIRDGRDVAMSWIDAGWQRYYEAGFEWPHAVCSLKQCVAAYPGRVFQMRYEDLVQTPEDTLRRLCDFLGEAYEPAMLDFETRFGMIAERDQHLHAGLRQPLAESSIARWQRGLSVGECFAMEACLYRELTETTYPLRFSARGWRPVFELTRATLRTLAPVLHRGIPYLQNRGVLRKALYY